ncbi:MAG: BBP7 family outer membrane beta-barrel protein, partial [Planctomycetes bacterium]|nr:BBP7 family outer membrane beta-barrel protein [Planctomycetota bacterium]
SPYPPSGYGAVSVVPDGWAVGELPGPSYSPFYRHLPVGPDGIVTERLPEDAGGFYGESPVDAFLLQTFKNTWVRLEYLHWNYERPGDTTLGAPLLGVDDPRQTFPVTVGTTLQGFAYVENLGPLNLRDNQGLRASIGLPIGAGAIEANIFSFQEGRSGLDRTIEDPPVGSSTGTYIATSTYLDNQRSRNVFLYDVSFAANFTSDFWGAEINYVVDPLVPGPGFKIRPLFGFQFFDLEERLTQIGVFDQNGFLTTPQVTTIDSIAKNRIYAPQLGVRIEYVHRWFTIGVEPKIAFGINVYEDRVLADQVRSIADPTVVTTSRDEKFAPIGDIEVRGQVHLTRNFSLFISYQILIAAGITRPQNNIYYNDFGPNAPLSGIVVRPAFDNMVIQGLSVGGELRFR